MKFEHDTVLQEYGVDRKPDIRQFHKLPGIHKEPMSLGSPSGIIAKMVNHSL